MATRQCVLKNINKVQISVILQLNRPLRENYTKHLETGPLTELESLKSSLLSSEWSLCNILDDGIS